MAAPGQIRENSLDSPWPVPCDIVFSDDSLDSIQGLNKNKETNAQLSF